MSTRRGAIAGVLAVVVASGAATADAHGAAATVCPSSGAVPYTMTVAALTGSARTDVTLRFTAAPGCTAVTTVKHVQIKTFTDAGLTGIVRSLNDVSTPDGVAQVALDGLERGLRIDAEAQIQKGPPLRTYFVQASTRSLLRPDLVVSAVHAPLQTLTTRPVDVTADIAEVYGDTGATAQVTLAGWQIIGVDPWDSSDWSVPVYRQNVGDTTNDQPEQELAAYAGPSGELTIVGLDTHGKSLNVASTDPPSSYSIGGLPPNTTFTLAEWNATGDGTNSIAGVVTTSAAGVARFDVPLQAAFALTTVPAS